MLEDLYRNALTICRF